MANKIVIVGSGFAGLAAAKRLGRLGYEILLIDRNNYHLFQPLLYQVATAGLAPSDVAVPIRNIFRHRKNITVLMTEVVGIDKQNRFVIHSSGVIHYDYLVLATGVRQSYFGYEEWEKIAPGLKSIEDASLVRAKILAAFEEAELRADSEGGRNHGFLNFIIVGGGPTGVEMAGAVAELAHHTLSEDFRRIDPRQARIILVEAGDRILKEFPEALASKAKHSLMKLGVEIWENARVSDIKPEGAIIHGALTPSRTIIWCAGVKASPVGHWLNIKTDHLGRVAVNADLSVPGLENIFVVGDVALVLDDKKRPLPGLASVARQQGDYVAEVIRRRIRRETDAMPFRYVDLGHLATVGRTFAIADFFRFHLSGVFAWFLWVFVHIFYLINFRNKFAVLSQWIWSYVTFQRGARMISGEFTSFKTSRLEVLDGKESGRREAPHPAVH